MAFETYPTKRGGGTMTRFEAALGGSRSSDICVGTTETRPQTSAERTQYYERLKEENSGPVTTGVHPVFCVRRGLSLDKAAQMRPDDLTKGDAEFLVSRGVTLAAIGQLCGMNGKATLDFMGRHGIKKADAPEYPWSSVPTIQPGEDTAPVTVDAAAPEPAADLTPADLTRRKAAELLAGGTTKQQLKKAYNFPNDSGYYAKLEKMGLHKRRHADDCKADPEEVKRLAAAVLAELEQEKKPVQAVSEIIRDVIESPGARTVDQVAKEIRERTKEITGTVDIIDHAQGDAPFKEAWGKAAAACGDNDQAVGEGKTESAVASLIASGEIKVTTGERPAPDPTIDLSTWELVSYKQVQAHTPVLRITGRGDGALVSTDLKDSDMVQFRLDPHSEGKRLAVIKAENGRPLRLEKGTNVRLRFASSDLTRVLRKNGISFPAVYVLEWLDNLQAWVGQLQPKD